MAVFSKLVTTTKGQALIAKMLSGTAEISFTRMASSDTELEESALEALTELTGIKQESLISKVTRTDDRVVRVEGSINNASLGEGYYLRALGLYADDPDEGEILYAAAIETTGSCYMPASGSTTASGMYLQLVTTVGNSDGVSITVDPSAVATVGDLEELKATISDVESEINRTNLLWSTCTSEAGETDLVAESDDFKLKSGAMISIKFPNAVPAGATLNISGTGAKPIYYVGSAIIEDVIAAGVLATFLYDGTNYNLLTIDKMAKVVQTVEDSSETVPSSAAVGDAIANKADKTEATTSAAGLMSAADKTKLDGLSYTVVSTF